MVRDWLGQEERPDLDVVLDALDDSDCRTIVEVLTEPMTASEISDAADVPLSTTYRKLDLLTDASLLAEETQIRKDGRHTNRYRIAFQQVAIALDEDQRLEVAVTRPPTTADEQLADLWAEVRREV